MKQLRGLTGLVLALAVGIAPSAAAVEASGLVSEASASTHDRTQARKVPTRDQWLSDVKETMRGSRAYVRERVASGDRKYAVNFDIDNTVLATYYDGGGAIPQMSRFTRFLERQGVAVVFNTGRLAEQRASTRRQLQRNGFPVDGLCLRGKGRTLAFGKQRCRNLFISGGYTLIANVGNNDTDFEGGGYEKAYVLPNYGVLG